MRNISKRKAIKGRQQTHPNLQEQLRRLAETVPGVVYTYQVEPDGTSYFRYVSPRVEALYGVTPEQAAKDAQFMIDRIHPEDRGAVLASVQASAQALQPWHAEFRIMNPHRGVLWIEAMSTPMAQAGGSIVWQGFQYDITQRKQTEQTLRLSQFTLESASEAVYWIRPDGSFFYANAAACAMLGYSHDQLTQMAVPDIDAVYRNDRWREHFAQLKTQRQIRLETTHRARDGLVIPVEVSANFITFEGHDYNCAIVRDITARRAQEQEQRLTRLVVQKAPDSIFWLREDGSIYYVNESACRSLGYSHDELKAMTVFDIDPAYSHSQWTQHWHAVNRAETIAHETTYQRRDGSLFPVEVTGNYLELDGQKLKCSIVRDIRERKVAEAELQQRTHLLESAQAAAHLGYYLTDLATRQWVSSPMLDAIMGIDASYVRTVEGWSQLVHPVDREQSTAKFELAVQQQQPLHHQYRIVRPCDGTIVWVDHWGVFEHEADHPVRMVGTVMDITERKSAELELASYRSRLETLVAQRTEDLANSEERFRLAMQATNDGLWDYNAISRKVYFNPTYASMLGYAAADLGDDIETVFSDLLHPDDRVSILKHIFEEFNRSGHHETEFRLRAKDGRYRWILGRGQVVERSASGAPLRTIGTHVDITERKQAEQQLRESERRFRTLFESLPIAYQSLDMEGNWIDANQRMADLLGFKTPEDLLGRNFGDFWDDVVRDDFQLTFARFQKANQALNVLQLKRRDGQPIAVLLDGTIQRDNDGRFLRTHCILLDVTERRAMENEIRALNQGLEQKVAERTAQLAIASAAKTQFLAHMSHELRTPMNAVLGLAQLLEIEPLEPGHLAMVKHIRQSGNSLLQIIDDILDFAKIEAGQLRIDTQPFSVPEMLSRVDALLRLSAQGKGLALELKQSPTDLGVLLGDPLRVEQILINLIGNAIKFTAQGGVIVSVRPVAIDATSTRIRFEIQDTGIGIAPDIVSKLFLPFSQADASITRSFGGTGLGLAICRQLVDLMGGQMGVTSEVGQGSTFWFELPMQKAAGQETETEVETKDAVPVEPQLTGLRILAVDDSRLNLMVVERALKLEGCTVTLAADGQQALQTLKAQPQAFDVVLMDIQMPVMDGLTATQEIRKDSILAHLPVIAITAGVLPEEQKAAFDAGVNGFLTKPLNLQRLLEMLSQYL
jgi:PAS domain S-box-containing protein